VAATPAPPPTLLGWLQGDLRGDVVPDSAARAKRRLAAADRSVQVHATHGLARQVEVLREVLVGLLEDDPTLEPRDILVMCPDIDTCAPLFQAAFGLGGVVDHGHPAHRLRVRLADRGLVETNPFVAVAAQVIGLAGGRATLTEVLDLAASPPVRHRFGFGDDELATVTTWSQQSGVRWGLNEDLRAAYQLADYPQNTWRAGLDRLLIGVAVGEGGSLVGDVLPYDEVSSAQIDLAGRLAEFVGRLESLIEDLSAATTLVDWVTLLLEGVLALGSAPPHEAWQGAQFERELGSILAGAGEDGGPQLRLADLRSLLDQRGGGRPTRSNFRTGSLTVCTMVPMRSVPHRVVCLVGLDDGVFPRATSLDGDDALARNPVTGERDVRSEDRQLLLDAVLAATERLVVTYTGANEVTGQERPPSVPLGELLDALDATTAESVRRRVLVRHPLQPYDPRNLTAGTLGSLDRRGRPVAFSFDRAALLGAQAAGAQRTITTPFLATRLPAAARGDVALKDLQDFFAHPARAFLRQRLDVAVSRDVDEPDDAMPIALDALEKWGIGDRMMRRLLDGVNAEQVFDAEMRRGELPPGALADPLIREVATRAAALVQGTAGLRTISRRSIDVEVDLGDDRRLTGVVPDVRGSQLVRVHYSSLGPKHRLASWIDLVALASAYPQTPWYATTVGWDGRERRPRSSSLQAMGLDARAVLADLVDIRDRGLREPLPLALRTAHEWAAAAHRRRPEDRAARVQWETSQERVVPGEQDDAEHLLVHGARVSFAAVKGRPGGDETWNDASSRLGRYAVRLWQPLLDHERFVFL
ncbi:MAG: exodeoxyribonuclease V subunit gamma, partial [Lapillicoccus sp.]